jgi:hypothetical protein
MALIEGIEDRGAGEIATHIIPHEFHPRAFATHNQIQ